MSAARMQESSPYTGEYFGEPVVLIFPCRNLHYSEEYYARRQGAQRDRGTPYPDPRRLGARKSGKDFHPPDGNRFPVCSPSRGNASRSIWLLGLAARGPSPFVATRHFPRTAGESSPVPAGLCPDPRFFEKNRVKLLYCATPWQRERHSREASAERDATYVQA